MSLCNMSGDCFFDSTGEEFATPSDDIWKKFDLSNNNCSTYSFGHASHEWASECEPEIRCELRHDCMWSGSCISKEHHQKHDHGPNRTSEFADPAGTPNSEFAYPDSPPSSLPECDSESVLQETKMPSPNTMHLDHSYGTSRRKPYAFQGLPTPSDSEEETDVFSNKRNAIKLSQLSEPLRKKLQLALATILNDNATSHIIQAQASLLAPGRIESREEVAQRPAKAPRKKPAFHNTLERQRRIELRIAFDKLRALLPELSQSERAPKASILDRAVDNCRALRREHDLLANERRRQMELNALLRRKMDILRSCPKDM